MPTASATACAARVVVAGQQLDLDPHRAQAGDRRGRLGLDGVGERDRADDPPVALDHDRGAPGRLPLLQHVRELWRGR